ncbi:MerR family transcriptional regulator [Actinokineospora auranticolor]|uniref:MerR-like DNA binding protein n=1 Tax=Actinokineospora auranticolor TaxID=155976 RepID=A0A2S6GX11_9PSEU|nr:MerR family transcriptional regulator [Actinokineospora auranticolor]PPK69743.1 MerR-like DNA binding protein [Actinokineospora auranticolor]
MRISELSRRSGVAVPTIKYYLREGILPPGERTSPNQARYDDGHVHRLRFVRALIEVGGLSVATVREVLARIDSDEANLDLRLGTVQKALLPSTDGLSGPAQEAAEQEVVNLLEEYGYRYFRDHPAIASLANVMVAAQALGHNRFAEHLRRYVAVMPQVGVIDIDYIEQARTIDHMLESVVVGTVLGDTAIAAVRRLAQTSESAKRFPPRGSETPGP